MPIIYVDDRHSARAWEFGPPITVLETIHDYLALKEHGHMLIIHGGQRDAQLKSPKGRPLLIEAIVRACGAGGRAIVFSGGHPVISSQALREILARESFDEGRHYLLLTAIHNLEHEIDLELLKGAQPAPDWEIRAVKRRHAVPMLLTLAVLCQAALLSFDPDEIDDEVASRLGGKEAICAVRRRAQTPQSERVRMQTPLPWQSALGRSKSDIFAAIENEWPAKAPRYGALAELIDSVFGNAALDAALLADAFAELENALQFTGGSHH